MSEKNYRFVLGTIFIFCLYLEWSFVIVILLTLLAYEGITNHRVPHMFMSANSKAIRSYRENQCSATPMHGPMIQAETEAEQLLRLIIFALIVTCYFLFPKQLWFVAWFVGFALIGAGMSGICPMVLGLRKIGFK